MENQFNNFLFYDYSKDKSGNETEGKDCFDCTDVCNPTADALTLCLEREDQVRKYSFSLLGKQKQILPDAILIFKFPSCEYLKQVTSS